MSVTASYTTEIVIPQPQLTAAKGNIKGLPSMSVMRTALQKIAQERGGTTTSGYRDCNGKFHECIFGLQTPNFPNGIGVDVERDGHVVFRYDQQGANTQTAKAICDDLARTYAVIAIIQAQRNMGYTVKVDREEKLVSGTRVETKAIRL
jgi:hypothetical protein